MKDAIKEKLELLLTRLLDDALKEETSLGEGMDLLFKKQVAELAIKYLKDKKETEEAEFFKDLQELTTEELFTEQEKAFEEKLILNERFDLSSSSLKDETKRKGRRKKSKKEEEEEEIIIEEEDNE